MKKLIVVLSVLLVAVLVGCLTVFSIYDTERMKKSGKEYIFESYEDQEKLILTREFSLNGSENVRLNYKTTKIIKYCGHIDIYNDEAGNEYSYNEDGKLCSYKNVDRGDRRYEVMPIIPNDQAEKLAREYVLMYFGEVLDGFELRGIHNYSGCAEVTFDKKYESEMTFLGAEICVKIRNDSVLDEILCDDLWELRDFDVSLLEGINADVLWVYAEECADKFYSEEGHKIKGIDDFSVTFINGSYYVGFNADIHCDSYYGGEEHSHEHMYYYNLKK